MRPRLLAEILGVLLCLLLIGQARCQGERIGRAEAETRVAKESEKRARQAAKLYLDSALASKKRADSLSKSYTRTRTVFRDRLDTLTITDTVEVQEILEVADSALVAADSVIATQRATIVLLEAVIVEKDAEILALNRQIKLALKSRPSKLDRVAGAAKWVGVGVVVGMAVR